MSHESGPLSWARSLFVLLEAEIEERYAGTHLGWGWAILKPVTFVLLLHFVAHHQKVQAGLVPYSVFALVGWVPWQFLGEGLGRAALAIRSKKGEFRKEWMHKQAVPASLALAGIGDFFFGIIVAGLVAWAIGIKFGPSLLLLPFLGFQLFLIALGAAYFASAGNAKVADTAHAITLISRMWLMLTPVFYPTGFIHPDRYWLFSLNPMVGIVDGFRWALLNSPPPSASALAASILSGWILFFAGNLYFRRHQGSVLAEVFRPRGER